MNRPWQRASTMTDRAQCRICQQFMVPKSRHKCPHGNWCGKGCRKCKLIPSPQRQQELRYPDGCPECGVDIAKHGETCYDGFEPGVDFNHERDD